VTRSIRATRELVCLLAMGNGYLQSSVQCNGVFYIAYRCDNGIIGTAPVPSVYCSLLSERVCWSIKHLKLQSHAWQRQMEWYSSCTCTWPSCNVGSPSMFYRVTLVWQRVAVQWGAIRFGWLVYCLQIAYLVLLLVLLFVLFVVGLVLWRFTKAVVWVFSLLYHLKINSSSQLCEHSSSSTFKQQKKFLTGRLKKDSRHWK